MIPARAKRCAATLTEPRPAQVRARAPTPGDAPAAEIVEQGLRPKTARRQRQRERDQQRDPGPRRRREQQRERDRWRAPEAAGCFLSTPAAAVARRHARHRDPAQQRGSPPARRTRSAPPDHRRTARPAVQAPTPIGPAIPLLARFARRCRQAKMPGLASGILILILIAAASLADAPAPRTALALGPLGTGEGRFQLCRRGHTQLAALQAGPQPPMPPAQPHGLDAPLRGGVGEAQLAHCVVEQTREPAPQCQAAPVDLVEMVQDVHFEAALIGGEAPGLLKKLLIAQLAERSSSNHAYHAVIINPVER